MIKHASAAALALLLLAAPATGAEVRATARQLAALHHAGVAILLPARLPAGFQPAQLQLYIGARGDVGYLQLYSGPRDEGFGIEFVPDGIGSMDFQTAPRFQVVLKRLGQQDPVPVYLEPIKGAKPSWISEWVATPKGACRLLGCGQVRANTGSTWANNELSASDAKLVLGALKLE